MKKRIVSTALAILMVALCAVSVFAAAETTHPGTSGVEFIVNLPAAEVSGKPAKSAGISFVLPEGITVDAAKTAWAVEDNPIIAEYDADKQKAALTYSSAKEISGDLFKLTVNVAGDAIGKKEIKVTLQLKNGATDVLTKDYTFTVDVAHKFATAWASDATNHWHVCENLGCDTVDAKEAHNLATKNDADGHWKECSVCAYKTASEAHVYDGKDDADCNVCGATRVVGPDAVVGFESVKANSGESASVKIKLSEAVIAKSGAIEITLPEGFTFADATKWLVADPLMAKFDIETGKAVFTYEEATEISGEVFEIAFNVADTVASGNYGIEYKLILKDDEDVDLKLGAAEEDGKIEIHKHAFAEGYKSDANGHWQECTECTTGKTNVEAHVYDNDKDDTCNVCNYKRTVSPKTGDTTNLTLWVVLLAISLAGAIVVTVVASKKKEN